MRDWGLLVVKDKHDLQLLRFGAGEELRLRLLEIFSQIFPFVTARRVKVGLRVHVLLCFI